MSARVRLRRRPGGPWEQTPTSWRAWSARTPLQPHSLESQPQALCCACSCWAATRQCRCMVPIGCQVSSIIFWAMIHRNGGRGSRLTPRCNTTMSLLALIRYLNRIGQPPSPLAPYHHPSASSLQLNHSFPRSDSFFPHCLPFACNVILGGGRIPIGRFCHALFQAVPC